MSDNPNKLGALTAKQLTGNEHFHADGQQQPENVLSFWRWAYSNLAANNLRGHLAEFLVATALDLGQESTRVEWDDCDLVTPAGLRIEVKSAAYLQSWDQSKLSAISFGIAPTYAWDKDGKARLDKPARNSDVYVFCLLTPQDKRDLDPANLGQWEFYVLPTRKLEKLGTQKTITLNALLRLEPIKCQYEGIRQAIQDAQT